MSAGLPNVCRSIAVVVGLAVVPFVAHAPAARADVGTFSYTGAERTYVVPAGVTEVNITASGSPGEEILGAHGGASDTASGTATVTPGQTLYVEVGGNVGIGGTGNPAFNGGGASTAGHGGGASDVRTVSMSNAAATSSSRLVVAGGGGGAGAVSGGASAGGIGGTASGGGSPISGCSGGGEPGCGGSGATPGSMGSPGAGGAGDGGAGTNGDTVAVGAGGAGATSTGGTGGGGGGGWHGGGGGGAPTQGDAVTGGGGGGGSDGFAAGVTDISYSSTPTDIAAGVTIVPLYSVTIIKAGAGKGTITGAFDGTVNLRCGTTCKTQVLVGSNEALVAKPASSAYTFKSWSGGGCSGHTKLCQVVVTVPTKVVANFAKVPPPNTRLTGGVVGRTTARFAFKSTGLRRSFQCSLVKKGKKAHFTTCKSTKQYRHLKKAHYVFEVRAKGPGGADKSPAKKTFSIS
jgi:ribosomal protein L35